MEYRIWFFNAKWQEEWAYKKPPCCGKMVHVTQSFKSLKKNRQHNGQKEKYKQWSTKHIYKTKNRITRTPLKTGDELRCSGRVGSSCSISSTRRRVQLVTNPVISHEWGKDREVFTTSGTYQWSFVTQIFHNGQAWQGGGRKTFEVMTST